ncbi:Smr/MutS family protein [uncultured Roseobacter sp.]|uniref:Smr/MutS family protein n=1 Tax=uncultured Roseobacter sp. TaxID=114847 RepID=UPI0026336D54|nr:Smr/MutS family protein [uncultured Roseobacter sp.]
MTRRKLSADEVALWRKVTDKTEALDQRSTFDPEAYAPQARAKDHPRPKPDFGKLNTQFPPKPEPRKNTIHLAPSLPDQLRRAPVQMDQKTFGKMTRGKIKPEGRIDLHGMTLDRAHAALTKFILSGHASGKRLVLVITGKGKNRDEGGPIPVRFGVLRHQVPQWLNAPPLASVVMQVSEAHISHGGGGAYYVYLRRRR